MKEGKKWKKMRGNKMGKRKEDEKDEEWSWRERKQKYVRHMKARTEKEKRRRRGEHVKNRLWRYVIQSVRKEGDGSQREKVKSDRRSENEKI